MKKKMILVISIILILGFIFSILNRKKNNTKISNSKNNTITVTTNSGVPYSWEYNLSDENIVSIKKTSKSLNNNDGGPVSIYFDIIPKKEGTVILTLNYIGVVDMEIIETKKYSIEVDKDLKVKINEGLDIEQIINNIISNGPSTSSSPFDYIKESREEYNELLNNPRETFGYAIKDLIETNANNGLKGYIEALLCHDINENFTDNFDSASDFLEKYKEFLMNSDSIFNEYDKYALSLFEEYNSNKTTNNSKKKYIMSYPFDDGRCIHFAFDVPYNNDSLEMAFLNKKMTLDEFISRLDYIGTLRDGGSKIYKYNKDKKIFGNDEFYATICNSVDNTKDIYVAKDINSLNDKCSIKLSNIDGVSMTIKDGTLKNTGVTLVLRNNSNKDFYYGNPYEIEIKKDGKWYKLNNELNFTLPAFGLNAKETKEIELNWEHGYGKLANGTYRIIKSIDYEKEEGNFETFNVVVEFTIGKKQNDINRNKNNLDFYVTKPKNHNAIRFNDYYSSNRRTIYMAGNIDEFYIENDDKIKDTLKNYISKTFQTFDDSIKSITNNMTKISTLWDGGTTIYKSNEKDITIIVCNTIDRNSDVYIGDYSMDYEEDMCK